MNPSVVSVNISAAKGTIKQPVACIRLTKRGITGDAHAGPWHRQVSMLAQERMRVFEKETGRRTRPGEFAENITTRGIDLAGTLRLDRFRIGAAELEVTQIGKQCHGDACAIFRETGACIMPKTGIFCRVVQGGIIRPGDAIVHTPKHLRVMILTVSDRASRGGYEDRSGPALKDAVLAARALPWPVVWETRIVPDSVRQIRQQAAAWCAAGADIIFTTGGTGIGPRDYTPEALAPLFERALPGIMEHIRLKFGRVNPHALLSRSAAGVRGTTLIFALPGSVKGVQEYVCEIMQVVTHALLMVHAIDAHA